MINTSDQWKQCSNHKIILQPPSTNADPVRTRTSNRTARLTQPYVDDVLHSFPGLCVQNAASHAQPHDGALTDKAADQDAQVAAAMVHQCDRT